MRPGHRVPSLVGPKLFSAAQHDAIQPELRCAIATVEMNVARCFHVFGDDNLTRGKANANSLSMPVRKAVQGTRKNTVQATKEKMNANFRNCMVQERKDTTSDIR